MTRAFVLVMDSFGVGATADADDFGDAGANTLAHISEHCALGLADKAGLRCGPLAIPNLVQLGLAQAAVDCRGKPIAGLKTCDTAPTGAYGYCAEQSQGKDTPSGHWEMMGLPVDFKWTQFPVTTPCFPKQLTQALIENAGLPGLLGNCHASGTDIIESLGAEHIQTGKPIIYTSADSVIQIAAHETYFGLQRLWDVCEIARTLADDYHVGRVIARPFIGEPFVGGKSAVSFTRTGNRRDLTTPPHGETLLDCLTKNNNTVISIGKIGDIFAHRGTGKEIKAEGNDNLFNATLAAAHSAPSGSLVFTNFVDFDMLYGHRRDVPGYAAALESFDRRLPELQALLAPDDIVIITADHGCDPTRPGSDHTREHIPLLMFGPRVKAKALGRRLSFADIGQSLARFFGLKPLAFGQSFYP